MNSFTPLWRRTAEMLIPPSTFNTIPTFSNRHHYTFLSMLRPLNSTYTSFIPESENTRQTFCFLHRALSYIPHINQQNALNEIQLLPNLISAFCWLIYGARKTILRLWTVGQQIKYVLDRSTSKEKATETGGHVHLFACTATQARPLIRVESTTRWSRVTTLILPQTGKTANKQGPLQFAVHVPKVVLNSCRRGSATLKYCPGSFPPTKHYAANSSQVWLCR